MARQNRSSDGRSESWKRKMGVEFSGLERTRDFLVAFAFFLVLLIVAGVVAFTMFG